MTDATILIPTFRHAALLPYALQSALGQTGATVEVLVVGDGVAADTRESIEPFLRDPRVRFLDYPKGERHGEAHRHRALAEAAGRIVCYLSDDDLLLADHVAEMARLLEDTDFAHSASFLVRTDGSFVYLPTDLSSARSRERLRRGGWNAIALTGAAHTIEAYRRLPHGWRPAPEGTPTDLHMWRQFLELPEFVGVSGARLTHLHFASHWRRSMDDSARVDELARWWARMSDDAFPFELERLTARAAMAAATEAAEEEVRLRDLLERVQGSWSWRLGAPFRRARRRRSRLRRAP